MIKYNEEHEWAKIEGNEATIGVSAYAVEQLGDITFIELPEIDTEVGAGESVAFVESVKAASDIYTPLSGVVTEVNEALLDAPEQLNADPANTWVFKLTLSDAGELDGLMDQAAYDAYLETL
jgi:glycine cleavage system H protein